MNRRRPSRERDAEIRAREFVYLDETSVTSLVAATERNGIPETVTEQLTKAAESETKSSFGGGVGKLKVGLEGRLKSSETSSRQVVRRTVVQGRFDILKRKLVPRIVPASSVDARWYQRPIAPMASLSEVERAMHMLRHKRLSLPVRDLQRGDVLEISVLLDVDPVYRMLTVMTSMLEMVKGRESFLGVDARQILDVMPLAEVLDHMLVGLVPIRGTAVDIRLVAIGGEHYLLSSDLIAPGSALDDLAEVVEVVGMSEINSYWKDLRHVLFAKDRYTAYVRLVTPGVRKDWNPVKLTEVFKSASIDIVDQVLALPRAFEAGIRGEEGADASGAGEAWIRCLTEFGNQLNETYDSPASEALIAEAVVQAVMSSGDVSDLDDRRATFDVVAQVVLNALPATESAAIAEGGQNEAEAARFATQARDDFVAFRERVRSLRESSMMQFIEVMGSDSARHDDAPDPGLAAIEVEFVAIYW